MIDGYDCALIRVSFALLLEDYLVDSLVTHSRRRSWYCEAWHAKAMRDTVSMFQHCYHVGYYGDIV